MLPIEARKTTMPAFLQTLALLALVAGVSAACADDTTLADAAAAEQARLQSEAALPVAAWSPGLPRSVDALKQLLRDAEANRVRESYREAQRERIARLRDSSLRPPLDEDFSSVAAAP